MTQTPEEAYLAEHGQPGAEHTAKQDEESNTATDPVPGTTQAASTKPAAKKA